MKAPHNTYLSISIIATLSLACAPADEDQVLEMNEAPVYSAASHIAAAEWYTQSTEGHESERGDAFGQAMTSGDFDGDGYPDLVIGTPGEDMNGIRDIGKISVFYGSSSGINPQKREWFTQNSVLGVENTAGDQFGRVLASGDFDNDGYADLAIGVPFKDPAGKSASGLVAIMYGGSQGLLPARTRVFHQDHLSNARSEAGDRFGWSLAVGNFNGDNYDDLAIGVPYEDTYGKRDTGMVAIVYGSSIGLKPQNSETITQNSITNGVNENNDRFGWALAAGNFNGDNYDDLAIGIPFEDVSGRVDTGMVGILLGSSRGLLPASSESFTQNSIEGATNESGDRLGYALSVGNFNGDQYDDLAVSAPYEDTEGKGDAGMVTIMYGSHRGLLPATTQSLSEMQIYKELKIADRAGTVLTSANLDNDGYDDLIIGVPHKDINGVLDAGASLIIFGSPQGILPERSDWINEAAFLGGQHESRDRFGTTITAGDFNSNGRDDIAFGLPQENVGKIVDAGAVYLREIDPALPLIQGRAGIVVDRKTGQVLGAKRADEPRAIASTTKLMTALVLAEAIAANRLSLEDTVTISEYAAKMRGSTIKHIARPQGPMRGDRISLEDLLHALLIKSDNTLAIAGAEKLAGNEEVFVELMNQRAVELGMFRTIFKTPHGRDPEDVFTECHGKGVGLTDPNCAHYSTPRDLALLADVVLNQQIIKDIVKKSSYQITTWTDKRRRTLRTTITNTNHLIRTGKKDHYYSGAYGVKTGTTDQARSCLVSAAERGRRDIVAVVLGSNENGSDEGNRFTDSHIVLDWGFAALSAESRRSVAVRSPRQ